MPLMTANFTVKVQVIMILASWQQVSKVVTDILKVLLLNSRRRVDQKLKHYSRLKPQ
jgi:hypothetical protein